MQRFASQKSSSADHIFFPAIFAGNRMLGNLKVDVAYRFAWLRMEMHIRFPGSPITLFDITFQAGSHYVFPAIDTSAGARNDVIDS
jgi:hypothetical protein